MNLSLCNNNGKEDISGYSKTFLKAQSCKLYNNKYMIALTRITNTEIFAFLAVLVFNLLSRKVLFINRKYNRDCTFNID